MIVDDLDVVRPVLAPFEAHAPLPIDPDAVALWIIEGFGRGELVIEQPREHDAFVLDVGRLTALYGTPCTLSDLRERCLDLGRRLARTPG